MASDLSSLIARLETATSRLEQVVPKITGSAGSSSSQPAAASAASADDKLTASVVAYDAQIDPVLKKFLDLSSQIGGHVADQAALVKSAFAVLRDILIKASLSKQPDQSGIMAVLTPLSKAIQDVQEFKDKQRGSPFFNNLSAIAEAIPALGWVSISPTPAPYVKEMLDAGMFYTNRVLKEFKEKDQTQVEWVKAWNKTLTDLQLFVKQEHTTGLVWNPQGGDVSSVKASTPAPPPPPGGAPPPPPPPPPAVQLVESAGGADETKSALFADLNKGADVTKGLKKVSDDMKTHKNPHLRQGPQPYHKPQVSRKPGTKPSAAPVAVAAKKPADKPAKTMLDGKKWIVEYHKGNPNIVIEETSQKQVVYIYKCENSTIQIKGKVNSITMDNCKKVGLVFPDVISSVDTINCQSVQVQVTGKVPTLSIDKTDGFMVYLSKDSLNAEIVTAKSSEMNILVPDTTGEYKEFSVPEQFKTVWDGSKLVTTMTDIAA